MSNVSCEMSYRGKCNEQDAQNSVQASPNEVEDCTQAEDDVVNDATEDGWP
jgi:hypothetical protein